MSIDDDSCAVTANQACAGRMTNCASPQAGRFLFQEVSWAKWSNSKPRHEIECERAEPVGQSSNRNFWIGPEQINAEPFKDTAPSEFCAPDGDCA